MGSDDHAPANDPQELARLLVERANRRDVEGMVALYEPEAVLEIGGGKVARGTAEIREFYIRFLEANPRFFVGDQRPALISGEIGLTSTRLPNGTVTAEVARRQTDGSWRWVIDEPAVAK